MRAPAAWGLLRPGNAAMAALGVLVGVVLAPGAPPALPGLADLPGLAGLGLAGAAGGADAAGLRVWLAAPLAAALVTGFGNVLNDLRDRDLDRRAHPERPLPSGRIGVPAARRLAGIVLLLGLGAAWLAGGLPTLLAAAAVAGLLAAYEAWWKRRGLPGNAAVALLVAATVPFGALAAVGPTGLLRPASAPVWALFAMAALANLAREVWKDLEDADADEGARRTLATTAGPRAVHAVAVPAVVGAVGLSVPFLLDGPAPARVLLGAADVLFLAALAVGVRGTRGAAAGQRWLKAAMLGALLAFLLLGAADGADAADAATAAAAAAAHVAAEVAGLATAAFGEAA